MSEIVLNALCTKLNFLLTSSSGSYANENSGKKSSLHEQILGTKNSDSESDNSSSSKRSGLSTPSKKRVTFDEKKEYSPPAPAPVLVNHVGKGIGKDLLEEMVAEPMQTPPSPQVHHTSMHGSSEGSVSDDLLKVRLFIL